MERVEGERRLWEAIPRSGLAMRVADSASMRGTALPPHFAHVATDPVRRVRTGAHAADYGGSAGRTPWRRSSQRSTVHRIAQGEGGEQGDPLMPLLSALGQHQALVAAKNRLAESEKVFAFHDDVFMVTRPARVGVAYTVMQEELFRHAGIQIQVSKTKVWNRSGVYPEACDTCG